MNVTEIARLQAAAGREDELASALGGALQIIAADEACTGAGAHRCIERPAEFALVIGWTSVAEHERFRETAAFQRYREALTGLLADTPTFAHFESLDA